MSLQPKGATNSIERQDRHEYATSVFFQDIYNTVPKGDFTIRSMREVRSAWNKDFSKDSFKLSDFKRLADVLPKKPSFDIARKQLNDSTYVKETIARASQAITHMAERQRFPISILDPDLRSVEGVSDMRKMILFSKGQSIRSLNKGEHVDLFDARDNAVFTSPTATKQAPKTTNPFIQSNTKPSVNKSVNPTVPTNQELMEDAAFVGWTSTGDTNGIDLVLGAYLSQSDQALLAKRFGSGKEGTIFSKQEGEAIYNGQHLLKHLRSQGIDFSVKEFTIDKEIDVRLTINNFDVRIFDKDPQYVGRVYDGYGSYYPAGVDQRASKDLKWSESDATATLDVLTGVRKGTFRKTSTNSNSQIIGIDGMDRNKTIQANILADRYDTFMYTSEDEAKHFIETAIGGAHTYFDNEFKVEQLINALNDESIDLETIYSKDEVVREKQDGFINDARIVSDMYGVGMDDTLLLSLQTVSPEKIDLTLDLSDQAIMTAHLHGLIADDLVGGYDTGFDPSFVIDHAPEDDKRKHTRNALLGAMRKVDYNLNNLKGNAFATQTVKDSLVQFNPESARGIDDVEDPFLQNAMIRVQDSLVEAGVIGENGIGLPLVQLDGQGIIEWQGHRTTSGRKPTAKNPVKDDQLYIGGKLYDKTLLKGEIGQIFSPNENGIIKTQFGSGEDYGVVPGYTGYFTFDGDYGENENRMDRFRVKGFEQHLNEQIDSKVRHQVLRPLKKTWDNIPNAMDGSGLNGLYHGDVYGRRVDMDFVESSHLKPEVTDAILQTLRSRVRFDNQYSDHATTGAETRASWDKEHADQGAFSYWKAVGETNMRVLDDDLANIADLSMTGTGKTQGLIWYLVDGAKVTEEGKVTPSAGEMTLDGTIEPDKTALRKLDYFEHEEYNAWDRVQMSANQLMTAVHVDENVGTALMSFGGWTFDDSYVVSQDFADRNPVFGSKPDERSMKVLNEALRHLEQGTLSRHRDMDDYFAEHHMRWTDEVLGEGLDLVRGTMVNDRTERAVNRQAYQDFLEEQGRFRPLKRGDKISDFGGNKGTIGLIVDRNMPQRDIDKQDLSREVAIFKANPSLDVVGAPYSMLSRHNAGVVKELMSGDVQDMIDPTQLDENGDPKVMEGAIGSLNIIVTDLTVDEKTHAYSDEDVLDGKGRKASGQLAWALQSKGATEIMNEIYGHNTGAWSTYREYLIATGLDMAEDGTLQVGYHPHSNTEERNEFHTDEFESAADFLNGISDKGGFLELPFPVEFRTGNETTQLPVLSSSLRQNTELVDGRMRRSDLNNHYSALFDAVKTYESSLIEGPNEAPEKVLEDKNKAELAKVKRLATQERSKEQVQKSFNGIQDEIIDRQFNGGHNGKHSFIRDKMMGRRMKNSATGVAIVDPRLDIGQAAMDSEMMKALDAKEGDTIMAWRDPVWRDGAVRAMTVVKDDSVHGIAINPIADKSHDMDFDGDTMGIVKLETEKANKDLIDKFSHARNMIDVGAGRDQLYFQSGMDLASAEGEALKAGDSSLTELHESAKKNALSTNPRLQNKALKDLNDYSLKAFREYGFSGDYVNLTNRETQYESFEAMVEKGAKGSIGKLNTYQQYFDHEMGREASKKIQYATGIKTDDTGLAGSVSQKLVSVLRNQGIKPALELSYPVTQGTLQIKHDAEHAVVVNDVLTKDINNLYKGKSADGKKKTITTNQWKTQMANVLENKLEVSFNPDDLDFIAKALSKNNTVQPIETVMTTKGSPMDQVAYGGGYNALTRLAKQGRSLLEGEQSKLFAPLEMREGTTTVLSKSDTRNVELEEINQAKIEKGIEDYMNKGKTTIISVPERTTVTPHKSKVAVAVAEDDGVEL